MDKREKLLRSVYERKKLSGALGIFSSAVSLLSALVFLALLAACLFNGEYFEALKVVLTAGVPFFAVGAVRGLIGALRPYEIYTFYEKSPKRGILESAAKEKQGAASFPSRHAYSAFVIATVVFFVCPWQGIILGALSLLMCVCRVLLGIHFIKDVLCGGIIGILAGVIGEFLIKF